MKLIFDNIFWDISTSEEKSLIKLVWKTQSEEMSQEQFKEMSMVLLHKIKEYKPMRIFADSRNFLFIITPDLQTWFLEEIIRPSVAISIRKHSELISQDLFSQVSIEQLHREDMQLDYTTRYFDDENKAWEWILQS